MKIEQYTRKIYNKSTSLLKIAPDYLNLIPSYSQVYLYSDDSGWVLDWEVKALTKILDELQRPYKRVNVIPHKQCVYFSDMFKALQIKSHHQNRTTFDYFHGDPRTSPEFSSMFKKFISRKNEFAQIRVSHSKMKELLLDNGIESKKIFQIPIGIEPNWFVYKDLNTKKAIREKLNIPEDAFVIGSFQKDGNGWGEGLEPKLVKGPDIFIKVMANLKDKIPNLHILLTGAARGYVKTHLSKLGIPFTHINVEHYPDIGRYFQALDLYLITSREEGGPKAILESMISGIPLVTTFVGQAVDLAKHNVNSLVAPIDDVGSLTDLSYSVYQNKFSPTMLEKGLETAQQNSYNSQVSQWDLFFKQLMDKNVI